MRFSFSPTRIYLTLTGFLLLTSSVLAGDANGSAGADAANLLPIFRTPSSSVYYIPQFANGGVYPLYVTSRISITNLTNAPATAYVTFRADDGSNWAVTFDCLQDAALSGTTNGRILSLAAKESYTLVTPGTGPMTIGWAKVQSNAPLLVSAAYTVFRIEAAIGGKLPSELGPPPLAMDVPLWTAGVTPAPCGTQLSLNPVMGPDHVMQNIADDAGIAIANPSDQDTIVTAQLYTSEGGAPISSKLIELPANGHIARFASEIFTNVQLVSLMQATIKLSANTNFTAMALQRQAGNGADLNGATALALDSSSARTILYDTELNNDHAHAQRLETPAEVYGTQCGMAGGADQDYYAVSIGANQTVYVTVLGENIGSKIDPILWLENPTGTEVATGTEVFPGVRDRILKYKSAATATFYIGIGTMNGTYGRDSFYRMYVTVK